MATTDMNPQTAMAMELIRGLLLSRMADNNRTAAEHQRAVVSALPCITGNLDALFGPIWLMSSSSRRASNELNNPQALIEARKASPDWQASACRPNL